jgi:hypothetical protein
MYLMYYDIPLLMCGNITIQLTLYLPSLSVSPSHPLYFSHTPLPHPLSLVLSFLSLLL